MVFIKVFCFVLAVACILKEAVGHGMMLDPPNRSSLWRFDESFPINYNDNEHFCGGYGVQWGLNNGKCGACGDNYADPVPRSNENTGKYGLGKVVAEYRAGTVVNVTILLTANHLGWFTYSICNMQDPTQPENEECFQQLFLEDGSKTFGVDVHTYSALNQVRLPEGLTCKRCVLRWHYNTGNSWGVCNNGEGAMGCGPQENFRSCADITIV